MSLDLASQDVPMSAVDNIADQLLAILEERAECLYQRCPANVFNVYIEGCIGSGKTVLTKRFMKYLESHGYHVILCEEEVDPYLLAEFYKAPNDMQYVFQVQMELNRIKQKMKAFRAIEDLRKKSNEPIFVVNDTGFLATDAFIMTNMISETIQLGTFKNLAKITKLLNRSVDKLLLMPSHVILIDSDVDFCIKNITERGRVSEKNMDINYLENLIASYNVLYDHMSNRARFSDVTFYKSTVRNTYIDPEDIMEILGFHTPEQESNGKRKKM